MNTRQTIEYENAKSEPAPEVDAPLLAFLRDRDTPCPACGYNLRGLTGARCPECGRELRLTVELTEPILRAWIALAVGIFASAGIGALFWMLVIFKGLPSFMPGVAGAAFVYFLVSPILIWPTLARRRRFLRMDTELQWSFAIAAILLLVVAVVIFVADVR